MWLETMLNRILYSPMFLSSTDEFYRQWYGSRGYDQAKPQPDFPFYSLYNSFTTFGQYVFVVVIAILAMCAVITLCIAAIRLHMANTGQETQEAKKKLTNVLIVTTCAACTTGFVAVLVKAFTL